MNFKKLLGAGLVAGAFTISSIGSAGAAVTFDPDTGKGFVGKGDVQTAFGLSNKAMQTVHDTVQFDYSSTDSYVATCTWTTAEGKRGEKVHNVDHKQKVSVASTIGADSKKTGQFTGWHLTGFEKSTSSGTVPVEGGACMGNEGHGGTWSEVEQTGSSGGELSATIGTDTRPLTIT